MARRKVSELIAEQSLIAGGVNQEVEVLMKSLGPNPTLSEIEDLLVGSARRVEQMMMARALEIVEEQRRGEKKMSSLSERSDRKSRIKIQNDSHGTGLREVQASKLALL